MLVIIGKKIMEENFQFRLTILFYPKVQLHLLT